MAAAFLVVCACGGPQSQGNASANAVNAAQPQAVPQLPTPVLEQPLTREQLLLAAAHAASDFAAGIDDSKRQSDLADRKFEFRIRFGCEGELPDQSAGAFDWSVNAKSGALKVRATPTLSEKDPPVEALAGKAFEAVEGFWIRRPWLLSATCPKVQPAPAAQTEDSKTGQGTQPKPARPPAHAVQTAAPVPAPSVGIAQFFTDTDPRTMRRSGRPYEATKKLGDGDVPSAGFDLVLTGRLVALPDRRVIACTPASAGERPSCVISVEFGQVSIERADTHESLAQWGSG